MGVSRSAGRVVLWRREKGVQQTVATADAPGDGALYLRVISTGGSSLQFAMSGDARTWQPIGGETAGSHLPPWDLAVRIALTVGGPAGSQGRFDWLRIEGPAPRP